VKQIACGRSQSKCEPDARKCDATVMIMSVYHDMLRDCMLCVCEAQNGAMVVDSTGDFIRPIFPMF